MWEHHAILSLVLALMVKVVGLRSSGLEFEPLSVVELTPGGVDSASHLFEVSKMSTSLLG